MPVLRYRVAGELNSFEISSDTKSTADQKREGARAGVGVGLSQGWVLGCIASVAIAGIERKGQTGTH